MLEYVGNDEWVEDTIIKIKHLNYLSINYFNTLIKSDRATGKFILFGFNILLSK